MQGFNMGRYVPPDQEGVLSFNQASGKGHALGSRARKMYLPSLSPPFTSLLPPPQQSTNPHTPHSNQGILTIRFELPFPIWCSTCPLPTLIGQGVRFNAEKSRVGSYHSTPILSFTFHHPACGGRIEIRTDPANTAYIVHSGARKRDLGESKDGSREGEVVVAGLKSEGEKIRLANDPFARVEERGEDARVKEREGGRVKELWRRTMVWEDPGGMNGRLRGQFRVGRRGREREAERDEEVKGRIGFGGELVEEREEDARTAGMVEFGEVGGVGEVERRVRGRPLFEVKEEGKGGRGKVKEGKVGTKKVAIKDQSKDNLRKSLGCNTRAAMDPFLYSSKSDSTTTTSSIKRKRPISPPDSTSPLGNDAVDSLSPPDTQPPITKTIPLVDYDSD